MLTITIPARELFDERTNTFLKTQEYVLDLEHSLVSLSKWESKWEKPFLGKDRKTSEETLDYIRAMTLTPDVPDEIYSYMDDESITAISEYINKKMTATWFSDKEPKKPNNEIITAELIYYWMIAGSVPFECQYWHLERLMTLLRVVSQKNNPGKKMSRAEILQRNRSLNAERKAQLNTSG